LGIILYTHPLKTKFINQKREGQSPPNTLYELAQDVALHN